MLEVVRRPLAPPLVAQLLSRMTLQARGFLLHTVGAVARKAVQGHGLVVLVVRRLEWETPSLAQAVAIASGPLFTARPLVTR